MSEPNHEGREEMRKAVDLRQSRREIWAREGERPLWKNLSMVGALGWLIVVPILGGLFLGRWLDEVFAAGVLFASALTFAGACLGLYLAWRRMNQP